MQQASTTFKMHHLKLLHMDLYKYDLKNCFELYMTQTDKKGLKAHQIFTIFLKF